jgi:hypothetical protein
MQAINAPRKRKRLILHLRSIVIKLAIDLNIDPKSREIICNRLNAEGVSFLTKTLPLYSKFALKCVSEGKIPKDRSIMSNFAWQRSSPIFLKGLLFDAISGSADALYRIRQLCDYFYKTVFSFTKRELSLAQEKYLEIDKSYSPSKVDWDHVELCRKALHQIFPKLCAATPYTVLENNGLRDGPGAFFDSGRISSMLNTTFEQYKKLPTSKIGSHRKDLSAISGYFRAYPSSSEEIKPVYEGKVADLRFVPKDSRGPRTISKEPYFLLKTQMAFMSYLSSTLTKESQGRVNFADQTVNQRLCVESSQNGTNATLDLKEASDRLWLSVLRRLGRNVPVILYSIQKLRSESVRLPGGDIHHLNKFANMGSGLCFPYLAMVTFVAAVVGVSKHFSLSYKQAGLLTYVYGDDLIVPTEAYQAVRDSLTRIGLLVNDDKSYYKGFFRESCGFDYYHGISVAPVRLRLANEGLDTVRAYRNGSLPIKTDHGRLQLERHARELVGNGLTSLAEYYYTKLEGVFGKLPLVHHMSKGLGRVSLDSDPKYVAEKLYVPVVVKKQTDEACGYKGLGRSLSSAWGLGEDFCLTPLRRKLKLKRMVLSPSEICMQGLPDDPRDIFPSITGAYATRKGLRVNL